MSVCMAHLLQPLLECLDSMSINLYIYRHRIKALQQRPDSQDIFTHACIFVRMCVCMYVCMYVCRAHLYIAYTVPWFQVCKSFQSNYKTLSLIYVFSYVYVYVCMYVGLTLHRAYTEPWLYVCKLQEGRFTSITQESHRQGLKVP